jgi:LysR family glycine cleavage system transcriptional activator
LPENLWPRWLALAGLDHEEIDVRLFDTNVLAYEAAAAGLGVALAIPFMCEEHLARGSLVPCGQSRLIGEHYRLYRRRSRAGPSAPETHFIHWARREARKAGDRFAAIG